MRSLVLLVVALACAACGTSRPRPGGAEITGRIVELTATPPLFNVLVRMQTPDGYVLNKDRTESRGGVVTVYVTVESPADPGAAAVGVVEHQVVHELGRTRPKAVRIMARRIRGATDPLAAQYELVTTLD